MFCFKQFFTLELSESPHSNSIQTPFYFHLFFVSHIDIYNYFFRIKTIKLFNFDRLSAVNATTIGQEIILICYVFIFMFFGKIYIRFCSDSVSTSETKPWPLLLFLVFLLDVSLVIVELVLDIGLVIVLEGTKTLGTKTLVIVRCFVTCADLPDLVLLPRRFFSFSC